MSITRAVLDQHGANGVELIKGDISSIEDACVPEHVAAVLIDVDLAAPTYDALKRLYARLSEGGVIVVDDCPEHTAWQAKQGYEEFCQELGIEPAYEMGMGLVRRQAGSASNDSAI